MPSESHNFCNMVYATAQAHITSLTLRSSRRQQLSAVGALRAVHCGAAYL